MAGVWRIAHPTAAGTNVRTRGRGPWKGKWESVETLIILVCEGSIADIALYTVGGFRIILEGASRE